MFWLHAQRVGCSRRFRGRNGLLGFVALVLCLGPGPALAAMLREAGHEVEVSDPFFAPDATMLQGAYGFITCTETAEHFHRPGEEFARLASMLRPGGILAVMTMFQTDDARFEAWHYRLDPTHVVFYRAETFGVIAARLGLVCDIVAKDVAFLTRPAPRA